MILNEGTFVRVRKHLLKQGERSEAVPEDTAQVPFKSWIKGRLLEEAELYESASIVTATGRVVKGTVKEVHPKYRHDYGNYVEEIQKMRETILSEVWGENNE